MSRFERNTKKDIPKEKIIKKEEESNFLKQAFDLFDKEHSGTINIKDAINSMKRMNFEESNPELFNLISSISDEGEEKITWEDFSNYINEGLKDRKTEDGLKTIFNLFIDNPENETITFDTFKKICKEIGENLPEEQLEHILNSTTEHGNEITFKDFIQYMKINEE
jgi:Ca2+-binding EF-hand superfamily protein